MASSFSPSTSSRQEHNSWSCISCLLFSGEVTSQVGGQASTVGYQNGWWASSRFFTDACSFWPISPLVTLLFCHVFATEIQTVISAFTELACDLWIRIQIKAEPLSSLLEQNQHTVHSLHQNTFFSNIFRRGICGDRQPPAELEPETVQHCLFLLVPFPEK